MCNNINPNYVSGVDNMCDQSMQKKQCHLDRYAVRQWLTDCKNPEHLFEISAALRHYVIT